MSTLILGDSIIKYQGPEFLYNQHINVDVQCHLGVTISKLQKKLDNTVSAYEHIIIHVGVNDVGYRSPSAIEDDFQSLLCDLCKNLQMRRKWGNQDRNC